MICFIAKCMINKCNHKIASHGQYGSEPTLIDVAVLERLLIMLHLCKLKYN